MKAWKSDPFRLSFKLAIIFLSIIAGSAFYFHSAIILRDRISHTTTTSTARSDSAPTTLFMSSLSNSWIPTRCKALLDPEALCQSTPQMAKDVDFGRAVIDKWNSDVKQMKTANHYNEHGSETRLFHYVDPTDRKTMYGHLVRTRKTAPNDEQGPGILFFHTGAGPHDISLLWKADLLACNSDVFPDGCVILVADILSDDVGWGWSSDRTKYNEARTSVLQAKDKSGTRPLLQSRIHAALQSLKGAAPEVDMNRLSAMGWCLGGHSILEIGRMKISGIKAMVTFHGVFDGLRPPAAGNTRDVTNDCTPDILICNGQLDPFVDQTTVLQYAIDTLEQLGHKVRLLNLEGAKHGFSNPAQDYNPNESFRYNEGAAEAAWSEAVSHLKETFFKFL